MDQVQKPSIIHHRQNPLESTQSLHIPAGSVNRLGKHKDVDGDRGSVYSRNVGTAVHIHTVQTQEKNEHQHGITVKAKTKLICIAEPYVSN
jgi:hypothetical protein